MDWTSDSKQFEGLKIKRQNAEIIQIESNPKFQGTVVIKDDIIKEKKPTGEDKRDVEKSSEERGDILETLFKELKDDMRERESRMEKRYQEQQELLLSRIDKRLDNSLSKVTSEISTIKQDVKDVKNSTFRWGIGLIVTLLVSLIGVLPQIINTIVELVKLIPNP